MRSTIRWRGGVAFGLLVVALTLFILLGGCERTPSAGNAEMPRGTSEAAEAVLGGPGEEVEIHIDNFRFHPGEVRVRAGTRIVFINEDSVEHNVLQSTGHRIGADKASFESPILGIGQRWSKVFSEPGEYPIICTVDGHQLMGMVGTIIVEAD